MKKLFLLSLSLLVGCASNPKFECPLQEGGVKCKSLKEVSEMVERGEINKRGVGKNVIPVKAREINIAMASTATTPKRNTPERVPEKTLDVWLASYETDGIFHQENLITIVAEPAHWVGSNGR